jgi:RHS repeat-associated protein
LFQGQEHQEETGWDSFKWRNHQPDIGRFFNVDPLAESFYYNSPYAFSENHVTSHVELEGLEKVSIKNADLKDGRTGHTINGVRVGASQGKLYKPSSSRSTNNVDISWEDIKNTFSAKIQVVLYGSGGESVVDTNEWSEDKETIVVDTQSDLPSPPGKGIRGGNTFKSFLEAFSEFVGFSDNAQKTIKEIQSNSNSSSGETNKADSGSSSDSNSKKVATDSVPIITPHSRGPLLLEDGTYDAGENAGDTIDYKYIFE